MINHFAPELRITFLKISCTFQGQNWFDVAPKPFNRTYKKDCLSTADKHLDNGNMLKSISNDDHIEAVLRSIAGGVPFWRSTGI